MSLVNWQFGISHFVHANLAVIQVLVSQDNAHRVLAGMNDYSVHLALQLNRVFIYIHVCVCIYVCVCVLSFRFLPLSRTLSPRKRFNSSIFACDKEITELSSFMASSTTSLFLGVS